MAATDRKAPVNIVGVIPSKIIRVKLTPIQLLYLATKANEFCDSVEQEKMGLSKFQIQFGVEEYVDVTEMIKLERSLERESNLVEILSKTLDQIARPERYPEMVGESASKLAAEVLEATQVLGAVAGLEFNKDILNQGKPD